MLGFDPLASAPLSATGGTTLIEAAGSSSGAATATATGYRVLGAAGASSGTSTASAGGADGSSSYVSGVAAASGSAACAASGGGIIEAAGTASGVASQSVIGGGIRSGAGSASATSDGIWYAGSAASASGSCVAAFVGQQRFLADPHALSVVSLLHCDEAVDIYGYGPGVDETGKVWHGTTVELYPSVKKFGASSAYAAGSPCTTYADDSADWHFGTGDFTIELWVYPIALSSTHQIFGQWGDVTTSFNCLTSADGSVSFNKNGASLVSMPAGTLAVNTWTHLAFSRVGGTMRAFADGVLEAQAVDSVAYIDSGEPLYLFRNNAAGGVWYFNALIDEWRVTKGVGRYNDTFAVQTAAFPNLADSAIYVSGDGAAAGSSAASAVYEVVTHVGQTSGNSVASAAGAAIVEAAATAGGIAGSAIIGGGVLDAVGSATAQSACSGIGGGLADAAASAAGAAAVAGEGYPISSGTYTANGISSASGVGDFGIGGDAHAEGASSGLADGVRVIPCIGASNCSAVVAASCNGIAAAVATSAGDSAISADGSGVGTAMFAASGNTVAESEGRALGTSAGSSSGAASAASVAAPIASGVAHSACESQVTATAVAFAQSIAAASGVAGGYCTPSFLERSSPLHTVSARQRAWSVRAAPRRYAIVAAQERIWMVTTKARRFAVSARRRNWRIAA